MNPISNNVSRLRFFSSQFLKLVNWIDCRKSFLSVFPRYLELPMSERRVLGVVGTIRGNLMTIISTNLSRLQLIPSQFSNLVDQTDCRKLFFGIFSRYLELATLERCILGVFKNDRRNPTNICSTNVSQLRLTPCQFSNLVVMTDYRKSFFGVFPRYLELSMSE